jgi:hypothetical protein
MSKIKKGTRALIVMSLFLIFNTHASNTNIKENVMLTTGTFKVNFQPISDDTVDAGRMLIDKDYSGGLIGTGLGQMLSKRTSIENSAVYVALEEFTGTVDGRKGSFSLYHVGVMNRGDNSLSVNIVSDSGTEDLTGISGSLEITASEGNHSYVLSYEIKP